MPELPTGTVTFLFTDVEGPSGASSEFSSEAHAWSIGPRDDLAGYGS